MAGRGCRHKDRAVWSAVRMAALQMRARVPSVAKTGRPSLAVVLQAAATRKVMEWPATAPAVVLAEVARDRGIRRPQARYSIHALWVRSSGPSTNKKGRPGGRPVVASSENEKGPRRKSRAGRGSAYKRQCRLFLSCFLPILQTADPGTQRQVVDSLPFIGKNRSPNHLHIGCDNRRLHARLRGGLPGWCVRSTGRRYLARPFRCAPSRQVSERTTRAATSTIARGPPAGRHQPRRRRNDSRRGRPPFP